MPRHHQDRDPRGLFVFQKPAANFVPIQIRQTVVEQHEIRPDGVFVRRPPVQKVERGDAVVEIALGDYHTCARLDDDAADLVREIEKNLRALARLRVLVGDVLGLAVVADILQVLRDGSVDVDLAEVEAESFGELLRGGPGT